MDSRLEELLRRLIASGPKCNAVSCSETHEIVDGVFDLQDEHDKLAAHVERLRIQLNHGISEVAEWMRSFPEAVTQEEQDCLEAMCEVFNETPAQSLNHIKAQVEEETIQADIEFLDDMACEHSGNLNNRPRKYKEQSDEERGGDE